MEKGRGRARGRGRAGSAAAAAEAPPPGSQAAAQPPQQSRPGPPPQAVSQPQAPGQALGPRPPRMMAPTSDEPQPAPPVGAQGEAAAPIAHGGGRATHRGTGAPRVGVEQVIAGVEGMAVAPRGGRRRGALAYIDQRITRPESLTNKTGRGGAEVKLFTNLFRLERNQQFHIYQYHVSFNPEVPNPRMRTGLLYSLAELLGPVRMFDGMQLFLPFKLDKEVTETVARARNSEQTFKVTIKYTNDLPPSSAVCIQLCNIVFKKVLTHIGMQLIGRNYFNPNQAVRMDKHKLEIWPGYATSILQFETSTMLSVDVSHKVLSTATVHDLMADVMQRSRQAGNKQEAIAKAVIGQIVITRYNNKTYRIDDINWNLNPTSTFAKKDGSAISYYDYYRQSHEITIRNPEQPLLVSMPNKREQRAGRGEIHLVPELCFLTGLDDAARSDFHMMKDLAIHTRIDPTKRADRLRQLLYTIQNTEQAIQEFKNWNMGLSRDLVELTGRQLPPEEVHMFDQKQQRKKLENQNADWGRGFRDSRLIQPIPLKNWVFLCPNRNGNNAMQLIKDLNTVARPMGIVIDEPQQVGLPDDNVQTYLSQLRQVVTNNTKFVVCLLPTNRKDRYDALKTFLCIERPVPSQMVLDRTLGGKGGMSVATKIMLQINCKMGGELWGLTIPLQNTMVVGIDTYHDSSKKGRSVAGVVASLNNAYTRYYTAVSFQSTHEELHNQLATSFTSCLKYYNKVNGKLPERIIVYRDGVGDGQLDMVNDFEMPQIMESFKRIDQSYEPKFGFVIVKKRISSRFFGVDPRNRNALCNPGPGTIVDQEATRPEWYDFFVVSQSVRQGTVSPTHYNIIHDTTGLIPDHYQKLTYKLCHLYYNWPGTIRVPAPCQYAHKVAFLVGQSLHKAPAESLADKLYYL